MDRFDRLVIKCEAVVKALREQAPADPVGNACRELLEDALTEACGTTRLANHPDTPTVGGWNCNDYDWRHQLGPNWEDRWERNRG